MKKVIRIFSLVLLFVPLMSSAALKYVPMEEIPGFGAPSDFPTYILSIYKFGLWTVGIAALLMIMIGGYMYLTSAGNTASTGKAKGIITDAIAGLILAFVSWLILYTINPDLLKIHPLTSDYLSGAIGTGVGTAVIPGSTGGAGNGSCVPVQSGPCSVENLEKTCFGKNAVQASSICGGESGGVENRADGPDRCQPGGEQVSYGLFQINLSAHCPGAFSKQFSMSSPNCTIKNKALHDACVVAAIDPEKNIQKACDLSGNGARWGKWGANSKCDFNK